jgi:hypothetical protein
MANGYGAIPDAQTSRRYSEPLPGGRLAAYADDGESRGRGWLAFAGIMIMIAATLNVIYGVAAISSSHFYAVNAHFILSDLNSWGWVVMLFGVAQFGVALGILVRAGWARWAGVLVAGGNAIIQLVFLPAAPFLALTVFAVDLLVIYGLVAYGGPRSQAEAARVR